MSQARRYGYVPDVVDPDRPQTHRLFGAPHALATPLQHTLERFLNGGPENPARPRVRNQLSTGECVGFALALAFWIGITRLVEAGRMPWLPEEEGKARQRMSLFEPSAPSIYTPARGLDRKRATEHLIDIGCSPETALLAVQSFGVAPERIWPFGEASVNDEPSQGVLEAAAAFVLEGAYRIDAAGKEGVEEVVHALAQDHAVCGGMQATQAFEDYRGGVLSAPGDGEKTLGGHYVCIVGYKTVGGKRVFLIANSWGPDKLHPDENDPWGMNGMFWADESFVEALTDRVVLNIQGDA